MDIKVIIIIVLLVVSLGLSYMLFVTFPKQAEAECKTGCESRIMNEVMPQLQTAAEAACATEIEAQVTSAVQPVLEGLQQCQGTLQNVMAIPACAAALQP